MQFSMQAVLLVIFLTASSSACPQGYGCYRYPQGCGETGTEMCDYFISWKPNGANGIDFSVNYKSSDATKARWAAIGFSLDGKMGDDDILMCRQTTADINAVVVEHYWSIGETGVEKEGQDGLSNIVTSFQDGYLRCNFTRAVSVAGKPRVYDLSETTTADMMPKYYFVAGSGMVSNDVPLQHDINPFHTSAGVDFTAAKELIKVPGGGSSEEGGGHVNTGYILEELNTEHRFMYWIGFNDLNNETIFTWSDGTETDFTNWYPGEPSNSLGKEQCVGMVPEWNNKWNDGWCLWLLPYVCKK